MARNSPFYHMKLLTLPFPAECRGNVSYRPRVWPNLKGFDYLGAGGSSAFSLLLRSLIDE